MLLVGISMMLLALLLLAAGFASAATRENGETYLPGPWPALVVGALMIYVTGYQAPPAPHPDARARTWMHVPPRRAGPQVGFGPISWLIISEVFPLAARAKALSVAVCVNFGSNLLFALSLQPAQEALDNLLPHRGMAALFGVYAAFCVASIAFVIGYVPETRGKTLEQIETMLRGRGPDTRYGTM